MVVLILTFVFFRWFFLLLFVLFNGNKWIDKQDIFLLKTQFHASQRNVFNSLHFWLFILQSFGKSKGSEQFLPTFLKKVWQWPTKAPPGGRNLQKNWTLVGAYLFWQVVVNKKNPNMERDKMGRGNRCLLFNS